MVWGASKAAATKPTIKKYKTINHTIQYNKMTKYNALKKEKKKDNNIQLNNDIK